MAYAIDTETIETPAGEYEVKWYHDDSAEQPYDDGFALKVWGRVDRINIETGDEIPYEVERAIEEETHSYAAISRYLRLKGYKGVTLVDYDLYPVEIPSRWPNRVYGVAWAPEDATDPDKYVKGALEEWRAWSEGDTFGWEVIGPDGEHVDSCWGYYGFDRERDYTLSVAKESAEADAAERLEATNLVGAGFVGII